MKIVKVMLVVSAASLVYVAAVSASAVDFTDEQFSEAAYLELSTAVGLITDDRPVIYPEGTSYYEKQFRLIPGRLTFYDIRGGVNAYVYFGYFGPGIIPTIEELISKSNSIYWERIEYIKKAERLGGNPARFRDFYLKVFPAYLYTNYVVYGVNLKEAAYYYQGSRVPQIILDQRVAEERAKGYFGRDEVKFVKYIWGSVVNGYEYTDGSKNIIVPFNMGTMGVSNNRILTREEVDRAPAHYTTKEAPEGTRIEYEVYWKRMIKAINLGGVDNQREYVDNYGTWCAFKQNWDYETWANRYCNTCYRPILDSAIFPNVPIFGQCTTIAMCSIMAYHHYQHSYYFGHNINCGKYTEEPAGGGEKLIYPYGVTFSIYNMNPCPHGGTDGWTARHCWLMGGFYTRFADIFPGKSPYKDFNSFYKRFPPNFIMDLSDSPTIISGVFPDFGQYPSRWQLQHKTATDEVDITTPIRMNRPIIYESGDHHSAIYGDENTGPGGELVAVLVYDWFNKDWPDDIPLVRKVYVSSNDILIMSPPYWATDTLVYGLEIERSKGDITLIWETAPEYEGRLVGYNVTAFDGSEKVRLNDRPLGLAKPNKKKKYRFKTNRPDIYSDIRLEVIRANKVTVEYPFIELKEERK